MNNFALISYILNKHSNHNNPDKWLNIEKRIGHFLCVSYFICELKDNMECERRWNCWRSWHLFFRLFYSPLLAGRFRREGLNQGICTYCIATAHLRISFWICVINWKWFFKYATGYYIVISYSLVTNLAFELDEMTFGSIDWFPSPRSILNNSCYRNLVFKIFSKRFVYIIWVI